MKLNKILIGTLLVGLIFTTILTGCSNDEAQTIWEEIQQDGVITVGNSPDYPPFETIDDEGNRIGFDIDLMNAIAQELGVTAEFKTMEFGTIITAVQNSQVDIGMSGFSIDDERKEKIDFTEPYFVGGQVIIVNPDSNIESIKDLVGKTISTGMGTTSANAAEEIDGATVNLLEDFNIAFAMLKNGSTDAVVADISVAEEYAQNDGFIIVGEPLSYEETAIVVQKDNEDLVTALNDALNTVKENGQWQELVEKWGLED